MTTIINISSGRGPLEVRRFVGLLGEYLADECRARGLVVRCVEGERAIGDAGSAQLQLGLLSGTDRAQGCQAPEGAAGGAQVLTASPRAWALTYSRHAVSPTSGR